MDCLMLSPAVVDIPATESPRSQPRPCRAVSQVPVSEGRCRAPRRSCEPGSPRRRPTVVNVCRGKCRPWQMSAVANVRRGKCLSWQLSSMADVRRRGDMPSAGATSIRGGGRGPPARGAQGCAGVRRGAQGCAGWSARRGPAGPLRKCPTATDDMVRLKWTMPREQVTRLRYSVSSTAWSTCGDFYEQTNRSNRSMYDMHAVTCSM